MAVDKGRRIQISADNGIRRETLKNLPDGIGTAFRQSNKAYSTGCQTKPTAQDGTTLSHIWGTEPVNKESPLYALYAGGTYLFGGRLSK